MAIRVSSFSYRGCLVPPLDLWVLWSQSDTIDADMSQVGKCWGTKNIDNKREIDVAALVCCRCSVSSIMFFGVGWLCWMLWPDCLLNMCMWLCSFVSFCFYLSFIDSPWFGFRLFGVYAGLLVFRPSPCLALIECKIQIEAVAVVSFQCKLHVKFF